MRILSFVAALTLALAFAAAVPSVASADGCTALKQPGCDGLVCVDATGDGNVVCVPREFIDTCQFRSDCCGGIGSGLWCPEPEDS